MTKDKFLDELNLHPQQLRIAEHVVENFVTVVGAGAGSGKTHTMIATVLYLLYCRIARMDEFILITFTNNAANELRTRLHHTLIIQWRDAVCVEDREYWFEQCELLSGAYIGTIHSFCAQLLQTFGYQGGISHESDVAFGVNLKQEVIREVLNTSIEKDSNDALYELWELLEWRQDLLEKFVEAIYDEARRYGVSAHDLFTKTSQQTDDTWKETRVLVAKMLLQISEKHQLSKKEIQCVDSEDLLLKTAELLEGSHGSYVSERIVSRYSCLFIDEFQDTSGLQKRIVDALIPVLERVLLVGDKKQGIYGFNAADTGQLGIIAKEQGTELLSLFISKRPTDDLLNVQNELIKSLSQRYPYLAEPLESWGGTTGSVKTGETIQVFQYINASNKFGDINNRISETIKVVQEIRRQREKNPEQGEEQVEIKDIVLLFRTNRQLKEYYLAFQKEGIPSRLLSGGGFYQTPEVIAAYQFLRMLQSPQEDTLLLFNLLSPFINIDPPTEVIAGILQNKEGYASLWEWLNREHNDVFENIREIKEHSLTDTVPQLMGRIYDSFDIRNRFNNAGNIQLVNNLEKLREISRRNFGNEQVLTLPFFTDWLYLQIVTGKKEEEGYLSRNDEKDERVCFATIHGAKGLEWSVVVIPEIQTPLFSSYKEPKFLLTPEGLDLRIGGKGNSSRFDFYMDQYRKEQIEEEIRILYVALTRAEEQIICIGSGPNYSNNPDNQYYSWKDEILRDRNNLQQLYGEKVSFR